MQVQLVLIFTKMAQTHTWWCNHKPQQYYVTNGWLLRVLTTCRSLLCYCYCMCWV